MKKQKLKLGLIKDIIRIAGAALFIVPVVVLIIKYTRFVWELLM